MPLRALQPILLGIALLVGSGAPAAAQQTMFRPVAVVNDQAITGYDLQQRMQILQTLGATAASAEAMQAAALDQLIEDRLKLQEGKRLGLTPTPEILKDARAEIAERLNTTPDALTALLSAQGVSESAINDLVAAEAVWREVVRARFARRLEPGEAEIEAELELLKGRGVTSWRVREIGLPTAENQRGEAATRELAEKIIAEVNAGADFGTLVARYSRSPSAKSGGDVGWLAERNLPPAIVAALSPLAIGQVSQPLPVTGGFSILQVTDKRVETPKEFDTADPELRERVRRSLIAQQTARLSEGLLQELRRDALIELR
ncbi:peptidylprolyl isomerase [Limibaculum sp. M0105]|uniref:Parvulin-like PPIase n=1 Tax=Thermohalobaculum xanthum TaxID=2753746 RepID=A0A8J7SDH7_9RHOB|nr:peptidylprolyl isomerase [Thermohalobaculum xanthum]MBK0398851.1 peptidylprolyl isomerase [Thermohalobaculum xanthum]